MRARAPVPLTASCVAAALAAWLGAFASSAPPPPPGVAPSLVTSLERPPIGLEAALRAVTEPARAVAARQEAPEAGGYTEAEALRRYARGRARMLDGQYRAAGEDFDAALRLDPGSPALHSARAEAARLGGDLGRALEEWGEVLARDPDDIDSLVAVGMASFEVGGFARCAALLGRAWPALAANDFEGFTDAGRFAIGSALSRSLYRLGFLEAGIQVALPALEVPPEAVAAQRGDGIEPARRAAAQLALETGEAALRCLRPDAAFSLFARSHDLRPDAGTVALAAYAQLASGDAQGARGSLGALIAADPWLDPTDSLRAEWLLEALAGDAAAREQLAVAAIAADGRLSRDGSQPPDVRARIGMLTAAAGDPPSGAVAVQAAIDDGAVDPRALEWSFRAAGDRAAPAAAADIVESSPERLREACRALVLSSRELPAVRAGLAELPDGEVSECLAAGVLAVAGSPGEAWERAAASVDRAPSRMALEALLLAAVSADDPALVARAAGLAPPALDADGGWHASLARAFADTGASFEAEQSLARAMLRAGDDGRGAGAAVERSIAQARAAVDGSAIAGSARARAEAAAASSDPVRATGELLLAHALDPGDDEAFEALVASLVRSEGPRAAAAWVTAELERRPNDPRAWRAAAASAAASGTAPDLLARIERRLAADPADTLVLEVREQLLRAAGRTQESLAAARLRIAALPPGARRPLAEAELALAAGDPAGAVDALGRFAQSAFLPPAAMRARALDIARRIPEGTAGRSAAMRSIARDAVLADPRSSLEFHAFDALGAMTAAPGAPDAGMQAVARISAAAAAVPELRGDAERWRACADFLLSQGQPLAAAEFLRARLADPEGLPADAVRTLARAAVACDAAARGRAAESLALASHLAALGHAAFGTDARPSSAYEAIAGIHTLVGDRDGAEAIMEAGLAVDPTDAALLNNLGYARLERGLVDARTESLLERAVRARPSDASALDSLGWLRYRQGRVAGTDSAPGALALLERAVSAAGRSVSGVQQLHLGDARWRGGDRDGARRAWVDARRLSEGGMTRERSLEVLREVFRRQVGLAAVDVARYHDENDGSVAAAAAARLAALDGGAEPPVAPFAPGAAER